MDVLPPFLSSPSSPPFLRPSPPSHVCPPPPSLTSVGGAVAAVEHQPRGATAGVERQHRLTPPPPSLSPLPPSLPPSLPLSFRASSLLRAGALRKGRKCPETGQDSERLHCSLLSIIEGMSKRKVACTSAILRFAWCICLVLRWVGLASN